MLGGSLVSHRRLYSLSTTLSVVDGLDCGVSDSRCCVWSNDDCSCCFTDDMFCCCFSRALLERRMEGALDPHAHVALFGLVDWRTLTTPFFMFV